MENRLLVLFEDGVIPAVGQAVFLGDVGHHPSPDQGFNNAVDIEERMLAPLASTQRQQRRRRLHHLRFW